MGKQKSPFKRRTQLAPSPMNIQQVSNAVKTFQTRKQSDNDSNGFSDTTSMKIVKKKQRKEARKKARLAREGQKTEDPFTYYFGEMKDEDK